MRCKNCGSENDEKLYICQNCGSPLYDEDEPVVDDSGDGTRVFGTLDDPNNTKTPAEAAAERAARREAAEAERKKKQQVTVIIVLVVVLLAIIVGTVIAVMHSKKDDAVTTTDLSVSETVTEESTTQRKSETTTKETTTEETTAETTTEQTTEAETEYKVSVSGNSGGNVNGGGSFKLGDNVTVTATPDAGYAFDGWYEGNSRVSTNAVYTFTVTADKSLKAVFTIVDVEPETNIDTEVEEDAFD